MENKTIKNEFLDKVLNLKKVVETVKGDVKSLVQKEKKTLETLFHKVLNNEIKRITNFVTKQQKELDKLQKKVDKIAKKFDGQQKKATKKVRKARTSTKTGAEVKKVRKSKKFSNTTTTP